MAIVTSTFVDYLNSVTTYSDRRNNGYGWFTRFAEKHVNEEILDYFDVELTKLSGKETVYQVKTAIGNALKHYADDKYFLLRDDLERCKELADNHSKRCFYEKLTLRICNDEQFEGELRAGVGAPNLFKKLFYRAGVKQIDLAEEINKLRKLSQGILEIGGKAPRARTLTSADRWGITDEELSELAPILEQFVFTEGGKNAEIRDLLAPYTNGWHFKPTHLRTSHAINLKNAGLNWEEIAAIQGVRKKSVQDRVDAYLKAQ